MTLIISAILTLFWCHDIANIFTFASKTWEVLIRRYEIHSVFLQNWVKLTLNKTCSFYIIFQWNFKFLLLTGNSDAFILFIGMQNERSMSGYK